MKPVELFRDILHRCNDEDFVEIAAFAIEQCNYIAAIMEIERIAIQAADTERNGYE